MNTYRCSKIKRFLCKISHRQLCNKKNNIQDKITTEDLPINEERLPLFIKNKSGRWIHRKSGKYVKKEVAEAYANHQR